MTAPKPAAIAPESASVEQSDHAGAHLIVVDDTEANREMLSQRLRRRGYQVTTASGGQEALNLISQQRFDAGIFDIMMPGMSGLELLDLVRATSTRAEFPVLMATAKSETADIVEALGKGANDYVVKPIDFPVLLARLDTQLHLRRLYQLREEFIGIASHDLKNPLFVIVCQAYIMKAKLEAIPGGALELVSSIETIERHASSMQHIISDFLDFQAVSDGQLHLEMQPVAPVELVQEVVLAQAPYGLEKKIHLVAEPAAAGTPATVRADPARLTQVLQNLIGNAIKFSPPHTTVTVRLSPWHQATSEAAAAPGLELRVIDQGPGLTEQDFERVFSKYSRLSNRATGGEKSSGLGLAICKMIVDLHGGEISVENNADTAGACFVVRLPAQ